MLNVTYFSNQFADREGHGLSRYSRELFSALQEQDGNLAMTPVAAWSSLDKAGLMSLQHQTGLRLSPLGRRMTSYAWTFLNVPKIETLLTDSVDVVHAVSLGYPVATSKPLVVTVHDIGPLTHPEYFSNTRPWVMKKSLQQAVNKASAIICVSESTASELADYVGSDISDRVHVVYEGVSQRFFEPVEEGVLKDIKGLPRDMPYIMAAGKISPRKNIKGLLEAFSRVGDAIPHHMVLVGGDGWANRDIYSLLKDPALSQRVHRIGYVTDKQLRALYAKASAYVHPSLYEGFGLTVLEAMSASCPVITSDVYSLPEVAGDAAVLVDPRDTREIADAIVDLIEDSELASNLRRKGLERARLFNWDRAAQETANLYRAVA